MRTLRISINAGEYTCAAKRGVFCAYLGSREFGQVPVCTLDLMDGQKRLREEDGWVLRSRECLDAERSMA